MSSLHDNLSRAIVELPASALRRMLKLVRLLDRLSRHPEYRSQVYPQLPDVARFDPGHDAVMMCYDFHLAGDVPRLIEVNTNAGGGLLAYLAHGPSLPIEPESLKARLKERLLQSFAEEIRQFSGGSKARPERIAIIDEDPTQQYLYLRCVPSPVFSVPGVCPLTLLILNNWMLLRRVCGLTINLSIWSTIATAISTWRVNLWPACERLTWLARCACQPACLRTAC